MIHAATLVHDDVIDAAQTRRGRPSTNVKWGNHTCVLAGDWLYMQAFQIALRERNFHILDLLIGLTQMMVEGELLQLERIGRIDVTEADCMELVDRKTACLFSRLRPPGRASPASADTHTEGEARRVRLESRHGLPVGGRLLDFTAREKTLGKPVGGDLREGKVTLPLVYALERATPDERALVETILRERNYDEVPFSAHPRAARRNTTASSASRNAPRPSPTRRGRRSPNSPSRPTSARCSRSPNWSPSATTSGNSAPERVFRISHYDLLKTQGVTDWVTKGLFRSQFARFPARFRANLSNRVLPCGIPSKEHAERGCVWEKAWNQGDESGKIKLEFW